MTKIPIDNKAVLAVLGSGLYLHTLWGVLSKAGNIEVPAERQCNSFDLHRAIVCQTTTLTLCLSFVSGHFPATNSFLSIATSASVIPGRQTS